jgi:lipopolysaccharide transport protein LptA
MLKHCFTRVQFVQFGLLILFSLLPEMSTSATGGPLSGKPHENSKAALSITSEKMVFQNLKDKIIFEGTVIIKKAGLRLSSDRAEVFLVRKTTTPTSDIQDNTQQVSKIIASGQVQIKKGTQNAKADKGVFDKDKSVITLTGNPELWEEGYRIKGTEIVFFMDEERTLVSDSEVIIEDVSSGFNPGKK